jgi:hypothetical protein
MLLAKVPLQISPSFDILIDIYPLIESSHVYMQIQERYLAKFRTAKVQNAYTQVDAKFRQKLAENPISDEFNIDHQLFFCILPNIYFSMELGFFDLLSGRYSCHDNLSHFQRNNRKWSKMGQRICSTLIRNP